MIQEICGSINGLLASIIFSATVNMDIYKTRAYILAFSIYYFCVFRNLCKIL